MKFLHLADLHLGKSLLETSLLDDQRQFLEYVLSAASEEDVDAIVIAGDIYDRSVPPANAVELLNNFLQTAHENGITVFAISGNHDSPERLDFLSNVLAAQNIHIAGLYTGRLSPITLKDTYGEVDFYLLPFLKPIFVRQALSCDAETTEDAVRIALQDLPLHPNRRNVLISHQFVCAGAEQPETCDSELVSVGGSDQVDCGVFDGFDYVALGHLHRPQRMGRDTVRYAGSPLKYSLSEVNHIKSLPLVTLGEKGQTDIRLLPIAPARNLRKIRGELEALLAAGRLETAASGQEDYIWAQLVGEPGLDPAERLRLLYPNLIHVETITATFTDEGEDSTLPALQSRSPKALFSDFFHSTAGKDLSIPQQKLVDETLASILERHYPL